MTKPTEEQVLRIAAKWADGWSIYRGMNLQIGSTRFLKSPHGTSYLLSETPDEAKAALADQLRTQVNAMEGCSLRVLGNQVQLLDYREDSPYRGTQEGATAMDQIRCIVEWGGLEENKNDENG